MDIEDGAIAAMRADGSVVVFVEDVFFEKLVTFQIPSGTCDGKTRAAAGTASATSVANI